MQDVDSVYEVIPSALNIEIQKMFSDYFSCPPFETYYKRDECSIDVIEKHDHIYWKDDSLYIYHYYGEDPNGCEDQDPSLLNVFSYVGRKQ